MKDYIKNNKHISTLIVALIVCIAINTLFSIFDIKGFEFSIGWFSASGYYSVIIYANSLKNLDVLNDIQKHIKIVQDNLGIK